MGDRPWTSVGVLFDDSARVLGSTRNFQRHHPPGSAPMSFYELTPEGTRAKAHYEGLPVEFVAGAIVALGAEHRSGMHTFHIASDEPDDGCSLDVNVEPIAAAGFPIERVPVRREWLQRFEVELHALPRDERILSSLGVVESLRVPYRTGRVVGSRRSHAALCAIPGRPATPKLDRDFIEKCLDGLRRLGLIAPPRRIGKSTHTR